MTQDEGTERAVIPRPAASIKIDPARLAMLRNRRAMSRLGLERAVDNLRLRDPDMPGKRLRVTRDALAKLERGERSPKGKTLQAITEALSTPYEPLEPHDFLPGQPPIEEVMAARREFARDAYHMRLQAFADRIGRQDLYRDRQGKIRYTAELKRMYQAGLDSVPDEDDGDPEAAAPDAA